MKKHLLYFSLLVAGTAANAQITITSADIATPGQVILRSTDTAYIAAPIGPGGTNMTWNYPSLVAEKGSTYTFQNPSSMSNFASFPSSNLGMDMGTSGAYLKLNSTDLTIVGEETQFNGNPAVLSINPAEKILDFPTTFGTTFTNQSIGYAQFPYTAQAGVDSLRVKTTKDKTSTADAWGSLTTPLGTFNAVRVVEANQEVDSVWVHTPGFPPFVAPGWQFAQEQISAKHNYSYWANSQGFPVMEIDSNDVSGQVDVTWNMPSAAGIPTVAAAGAFKVYPNPATTNATFDLRGTNTTRFEIYNAVGELVLSQNVNTDILNFSTEGLANGLYYAKFYDAKQVNKGGSKFYIAK